MKASLVVAALVVLAIFAGNRIALLQPIVSPPVLTSGAEAGEQAAGASLLGQFRSSLADSLYERADLYLHKGVALRPMTTGEKDSGLQGASVQKGEIETQDESSLTTVVPGPEEDFRGILGDLERASMAYHDMHNHKHSNPESTFPLFRLMTWIDPHYIRGWVEGGLWAGDPSKPDGYQRRLDFLQQGLAANPNSPEITIDVAKLIALHDKDYKTPIRLLESAKAAADARGYAKDQKDSVSDLYGLLADCYNLDGDKAKLKAIVLDGLKKFPDNKRLITHAIHLGLPWTLPKS